MTTIDEDEDDPGALFDGGVFDEPEHIADAEYRASLHNLDDYR